jgi:hypothetical protein
MNIVYAKSWFLPRNTVAFGTVITDFVPPMGNVKTKMTYISYTAAGTAHTVTILRSLAKTNVRVAAAASATSLILNRDPGNYSGNATLDGRSYTPSVANNLIAANDYILVQKADGGWLLTTCSAVSTDTTTAANASDDGKYQATAGRVTLTVAALPAGGILAGAPVYFFGITTDTHPVDNKANPILAAGASVTTTRGDGTWVFVESVGENEPLMVHSNNATATGILENASGIYAP